MLRAYWAYFRCISVLLPQALFPNVVLRLHRSSLGRRASCSNYKTWKIICTLGFLWDFFPHTHTNFRCGFEKVWRWHFHVLHNHLNWGRLAWIFYKPHLANGQDHVNTLIVVNQPFGTYSQPCIFYNISPPERKWSLLNRLWAAEMCFASYLLMNRRFDVHGISISSRI